MGDPIAVSGRKRLEDRDPVWEVSIHGANRCASPLGHHCCGQEFVADIVDGVTGRVEKRVDASGASRLNGFNPNRHG
jgi:hypothetical protein